MQDLTGSNTFHTTITVPEAGDDRKAASIVPAFQALLDNTANLDFKHQTFDANEHLWSQHQTFADGVTIAGVATLESDPVYSPVPTRKVFLPLRPIFPLSNYADPQWLHADSNLQWAGASNDVRFTLVFGKDFVVSGARIKAVRAAISSSVGVELTFTKFTYPTAPGSAAPGTAGTVYTNSVPAGSLGEHLLEITCDELVELDRHLFRVRLELTEEPPSFALRWVQLEFTDPGPRNY